ncbi:MAG: VWA domain-containing protein [Candidatus Dojkabacteria bacterium]|nr:MAG: VWA domain-containing protein [Candidatus Dojkabacteria bacterium]
MIFKYTLWGILCAVITAVAVYFIIRYKKGAVRALFVPTAKKIKKSEAGAKTEKKTQNWKDIAEKAVLFITIAALLALVARPMIASPAEDDRVGLDIMLTVDISGSMTIEDVPPSRIDAAREVITEFLKKLSKDRVGLVVFTGVPVTLSPLTQDYAIVQEHVDLLTPDKSLWLSAGGGTAVGDALFLTTKKFQQGTQRSKVAILITDGQSNIGIDPSEAADIAAQSGIKVYTIYIGSFFTSRAKDSLANVAQKTGGKAYTVENKKELATIFDEIDRLERGAYQGISPIQYRDSPTLFLLIAALGIAVYLGLTSWRLKV